MKLTKQQEQQMEAQHLKRCILEDGFEILEIAGENPHDYPTYDSLQQATNSIYHNQPGAKKQGVFDRIFK